MLAIYLNDHLAAATAGCELAKRSAGSNRGSSYGPFLEELASDIASDRQTLQQIMHTLDVRADQLKVLAGWAGEKVGRLKLNGRLLGYSPLSRVVELEALTLGVRGKLGLWHALERIEPRYPALSQFVLGELIARAERQLEELERYRLAAVEEAMG